MESGFWLETEIKKGCLKEKLQDRRERERERGRGREEIHVTVWQWKGGGEY